MAVMQETTTFQIVIVMLLIVLMSIATAWLYRRIVSGIVVRREEREAVKLGRLGGRAKERIERTD